VRRIVTDLSGITTETADISLKWYTEEMLDTGGVPLTGFRLYLIEAADQNT
jgi:hypothetical protein